MRITVLLGGTSAERDVSLVSGLRICEALRSKGHTVVPVDPATGVISPDLERRLLAEGVKTRPPSMEELRALSSGGGGGLSPTLGTLPAVREAEVVFLALHGGQGEDGTVQALLDMAGVRYTGSGHLASALAMDKDLSKKLFRAAGVQTADWMMVNRGETVPAADLVGVTLGYPVIVKPSKQGSTVGLSLVEDPAKLAKAVAEAGEFDDEVMLEQFIAGRELTVAILGDEALPVGEIKPKHALYDYECKYTSGMAEEEFPARLSAEETAMVQAQALSAFHALKLRGCARIDFRMSPEGGFYCLEANTLPGMTALSLVPQAAAAQGMSFPDLCERIVRLAAEDPRG